MIPKYLLEGPQYLTREAVSDPDVWFRWLCDERFATAVAATQANTRAWAETTPSLSACDGSAKARLLTLVHAGDTSAALALVQRQYSLNARDTKAGSVPVVDADVVAAARAANPDGLLASLLSLLF